MRTYELAFIINPEITLEEAKIKAKEIESLVQKKEGEILKHTDPNVKTLAYPIKKNASGFLGILEFKIEPEKTKEIQAALSKDEKIIRQMLLTKKPAKAVKEKRGKTKPNKIFTVERGTDETLKEESGKTPSKKEKIELKDIEEKLDELLGE